MKNPGQDSAAIRAKWGIAAGVLVVIGTAACAVMGFRSQFTAKSAAVSVPQIPSAVLQRQANSSYGKLPIAFEMNLGQADPRVKFLAHGGDGVLFLTETGAVLRLQESAERQRVPFQENRDRKSATDNRMPLAAGVAINFAGSNANPRVEGLELQPGRSNYFIGRDPSRWRTNVPLFQRVKYANLYPGVDLVFYGHDGKLESDYVLSPGADPDQIALQIEGAQSVKSDPQGDLVLSTNAGNVVLREPHAFQEIAGTNKEVEAHYVLRRSQVAGIQLASYDRSQPLVIDPVLDYSTMLGGSGGDSGNSIAVDSNGNAWIAGATSSTDFPTTNGVFQTTFKSTTGTNAFVTELNSTGTQLIFSTYFGGSGSDSAVGIGIDGSGDAFITGTTTSFDLPIAGSPLLNTFPAGNLGTTGFFSELSSSGSALTYSTYLGGNTRDVPSGLAVDSSGNCYVVGTTSSSNFPLSTVYGNAYQTFSNAISNGGGAAFLSKISTNPGLPGFQGLLYSTYLGGSDSDGAAAVAADSFGNAYITGTAASTDFPMTVPPNGYQTSLSPGTDDAYVVRINTTLSGTASLIYSSYLGGTGTNGGAGLAIAADSSFNAYVGGTTAAANFPVTANAFMPSQPSAGYIMGFVARFNTSFSGTNSLTYSTYLGGSNVSGNYVYGIAADSLGDAYVTGSTYTNNYPLTPGPPQALLNGISNAILTVVNPAGTNLLFSTYWGGVNNDQANGIVLDSAATPNAYFVGTTKSSDFPTTTGAYQSTHKGLTDAFIVKMSPGAALGVFATPSSIGFGNQGVNSTSTAQTVTLANNTGSALDNIAITLTGTNPGDFAQTNTCGSSSTANGTLSAFQACTISVTFTPTATGADSATLNIADSATNSPQQVALTGTGTAISVSPSSLTFASQAENTTSPAQTVTLTNNGTTALTMNGISFTGTNAGDFAQTNTCGASVAAATNCTISVTFTPTTQSAESATMQISDSDPSSPQTVALTGTGTAPTSGVSISPTSLNFGNQSQGTASPAMNVTLTNTGSAQLTGITFSFTGTNAADFSETDTCGAPGGSLAGGGGCTVSVTFKPSTQAAESASLSIADSAPTSPQSVPLTGTGTAPVTSFAVTLSPSSATIKAGQSTVVTATVTSENAFNSAVNFSFTGCPGDSSCSASPNPVTPPANGTITSTFTIQTNLVSGGYPGSLHFPSGSQRPIWVWTLLTILLVLSGLWAIRRRGAKSFACVFAMLLLMGLASCTGTPSTPTGTYQVQVKGTSGSQSFPVTFTLTVQ
jgi:hypothetical protein